MDLDVQKGIPLVYELDNNFNPTKNYYLGKQNIVKNIINKVKNMESNKDLNITIVDKLNEEQEKDIWELVKKSDDDFVPPLSSRVDTVHKFNSHPSFKNEKDREVLLNFSKK